MPVSGVSGAGRPPLTIRLTAVFLGIFAIWTLLSAASGEDYTRPAHIARAIGATALTLPLIVVAPRLLDRAPFSTLRLTSLRVGWRSLLIGVLCWAIPAVVAGAIVVRLGWATLTVTKPPGSFAAGVAALTALVFLYEALPEELIFRGYFQANLAERSAPAVAVVAQAGLFTVWAMAIGAAASIDRVVLLFTFGCALGILRAVTDNLWTTIGFHWAFQLTAQFLGPSWDAVTLDDPHLAFGVAISLVPFAATLPAPAVLARRRRR